MEHLVILNKNDLRELLQEMIPGAYQSRAETNDETSGYLPFNDGVEYVNKKGIPISKNQMYRKTAAKEIPFRRFGKRKIVFIPEELDQWIDGELSRTNNAGKIAKSVAESARRKL